MDFLKMFYIAVFTGVAFVVLWEVTWEVFVPEVLPILTWSGHDVMIAPLFVIGCFGGAVGGVLSNR